MYFYGVKHKVYEPFHEDNDDDEEQYPTFEELLERLTNCQSLTNFA